MEWQLRNDLPIYSQLIEQIKQAIVSGAFPPGERLASVRDLAMEAGVNPNTMQRALQELEREGLVFSQRTSGRFAQAGERAGAFLSSMEKLGYSGEEILSLIGERLKEENHGGDT